MEIGYVGNTQCVPSLDSQINQPTIEQRLLQKKSRLEADLADINNALEALQANPEVLKIMCLISKVNY